MGVELYTAAKAGVDAFTRQAAVEWGPPGVRVNAIAPGMVRTAMAEAVYSVPELLERRSSMVPLRRIGTPADIGRVAAFLLSDDASYVTGQTITVDSGFTSVPVDLAPSRRMRSLRGRDLGNQAEIARPDYEAAFSNGRYTGDDTTPNGDRDGRR